MSYRNLVKDAWDVEGFEELKDDAEKAKVEAVMDIFHYREAIQSLRKKIRDLDDKERKKK